MNKNIANTVRELYGAAARSGVSSADEGARAIAQAFGYSADQLAAIPEGANLGLSCGNPTAMAALMPGEVVVDLGAGGGLDVFLAAKLVGPLGKAVGIDMTPDMVELAKANAEKQGISNAEFHLAEIVEMPLDSNSADCVISNCVLNLVEDKPRAFAEIFRILKPGGRLAVSDIVLKRDLPDDLRDSVAAYVGCISGAIGAAEYQRGLAEAGFSKVEVADTGADLNVYAALDGQAGCCAPAMAEEAPAAKSSCCGPSEPASKGVHEGLADLIAGTDLNQYAFSARISAVKP